MISLSDTLLTAAGLLGLGAAAAPIGRAEAQAFSEEGRMLSPEAPETDDPFFLAVAEGLREAGYLDSEKSLR